MYQLSPCFAGGQETQHWQVLRVYKIQDNLREYQFYRDVKPTICPWPLGNIIGFTFHQTSGYFSFPPPQPCDTKLFFMFGVMTEYNINYCCKDKRQFQPQVSWVQAFRKCKSLDAQLPILRTREEMNHFLAFVKFSPQFYCWKDQYLHPTKGSPSVMANEAVFTGMVINHRGQVSDLPLSCWFLDLGDLRWVARFGLK